MRAGLALARRFAKLETEAIGAMVAVPPRVGV